MPVTLVALHPQPPGGDGADTSGFHLNWTGWGVLRDLLIELGCDLTQLSVTNNAEVVDAATSAAWGHAISDALAEGRIYTVHYRDGSFVGDWREEMHVEGTDTPVLLSSAAAMRTELGAQDDTDLDYRPLKGSVSPESEPGRWLSALATFMAGSGGFAQC
jgi:hypothetical protein